METPVLTLSGPGWTHSWWVLLSRVPASWVIAQGMLTPLEVQKRELHHVLLSSCWLPILTGPSTCVGNWCSVDFVG